MININENCKGCKTDLIRWGMAQYHTLGSIMWWRKYLYCEIMPRRSVWTYQPATSCQFCSAKENLKLR